MFKFAAVFITVDTEKNNLQNGALVLINWLNFPKLLIWREFSSVL